MNYGIKISHKKGVRRGVIKWEDGTEIRLSAPQTEEFDQWIDFRAQGGEAGTIEVKSRSTLSEGLRQMVIAYTLPMVLVRLVDVIEDLNSNETDEEERYTFNKNSIKLLAPVSSRIEKDFEKYQASLKFGYEKLGLDVLKGGKA